jgi:hypothetical protein
MRKPGPTTIDMVDVDHPGKRPAHRGHSVEIQGWNSEYVALVIWAGDEFDKPKAMEAIISPDDLMRLAEKAKAEAHHW